MIDRNRHHLPIGLTMPTITPEPDVRVEHTFECDLVSYGDDCVGGCPTVPDN